ncbi:MAG: imelysin family protein [Salibacteraceae bacterium]
MLLLTIAVASCVNDDDGDDPEVNFDQGAMLTTIGNNVIVPSFETLNNEAATLETEVSAFVGSPTESGLASVRAQYIKADKAWQRCAAFNFGPSATFATQSVLNTWPTNPTKIEDNITNGGYNLQTSSNLTASGFPALDYLLYGSAADEAAIVNRFSQEQALKDYLVDVVDIIVSVSGTTYDGWLASSSTNYLETFVQTTGTDIGSSIGLMVNEFSKEIELVKNARVGIPLGKKSLNVTRPDQVEALYSGMSVEFSVENMKGLKALFMGLGETSSTANGLFNYLEAINAQEGDGLLSNAIRDQFDLIDTRLNDIQGNLFDAVDNDFATVDAAYTEIQRLVVLVKTDMTSAMGVQITYQDNDGD